MHARSISTALLAALVLCLPAGSALAAPDIVSSVVVNEDDGIPGFCLPPCFALEKSVEVYLAGNPTAPGVCAPTDNTYLYTLTHVGGSLPAGQNAPVTQFELQVDQSLVSSAGFVPGPGVAPSATTVSPLNVVTWDFLSPFIFEGQTSTQLFLCSPAPPGAPSDTLVSVSALGSLDAPGECIGPVQSACSLEVDKTCCIPQAAIPNGDLCEGKAIRLAVEVAGGECTDTTNDQEGKLKCSGPNPVVNPLTDTVDITVNGKNPLDVLVNGNPGGATGIPVGSVVEFTHVRGQLKANTKFSVSGPGGTQNLTIHTSCSKALQCDDQFGSVKLVELETTLGGVQSCTAPAPNQTQCVAQTTGAGTPCDSKLTEAVFKFQPSACTISNPQNGEASCSGDATDANLPVSVVYTGKKAAKITVSPSAGINPGDTFSVTATGQDALHPNVKLIIQDDDSVEQTLEMHVSCSQPLACGDQFGSLTLVGFRTKNGTNVSCDATPPPTPFADACEVPLAPPKPHCTGDLERLQLVYLGDLFGSTDDPCTVSNGQNGKASCVGGNLSAEPVSITITDDPAKVEADPATGINVKGLFEIRPINSADKLPSSITFDASDGVDTQTVKIHTSCSQPLDLGDRFGDFVIFGMDRGDGDDAADSDSDSDSDPVTGAPGEDGLITLGGVVEYQYKVTNPNATDVVNVTVDDDPHGLVVMGETIPAGGMKTFFTTKTLFESVTNTATVMGELATGGECAAAQDSVDVTVTLPPPGAFDCKAAKPIDGITLEWAGTQDITVRAFDGAVGSTILRDVTDGVVMPGDVVEVTGMGGSPNDQVWQIFDASGTVLLGESKFHISCSDANMNGVEDCGKNQGDGKDNQAGLINDWLLEGLTGDEVLECTPIVVSSGGGGGSCGFGFELAFLLPGLMWLHRRRRRA